MFPLEDWPSKFYLESGETFFLGKELGKGALATVYLQYTDDKKAVKIFKPEIIEKEINLSKRIEKLILLSNIADLEVSFAGYKQSIGSWPKEIVKDHSDKVVGYTMDAFNDAVDLSYIIMARDPKTAFYKYRNNANYSTWIKYFLYNSKKLKNRFVISYYLTLYFDKIYNLKTKDGKKLNLEICNFDIKPQNIMVSIENIDGKDFIVPSILDLDNLTLKNSTKTLSPINPSYTPEYRAPEGPIDKYYDYWSIAVIFYQLIFNQHPFEAVMGGDKFSEGTERDFFVKNKCFPWGRNREFLSKQTQNDFRHGNFLKVSTDIQSLFVRAFDSDLPSSRPSMAEWNKALLSFLSDPKIDFENLFEHENPISISQENIAIKNVSKDGINQNVTEHLPPLPLDFNSIIIDLDSNWTDKPFSKNKTIKCPVIILFDTSGDENGFKKNEEFNNVLLAIKKEISEDPILSIRLDLCVLSFEKDIKIELDFDSYKAGEKMPLITNSNSPKSDILKSINKSIEYLYNRIHNYTENDDQYYKPYILVISEGIYDNTLKDFLILKNKLQDLKENRKCNVLFFGVGNVDMPLMNHLWGKASKLYDNMRYSDIFICADDLDEFYFPGKLTEDDYL